MQSTISNARAVGRFAGATFLAVLAAVTMSMCAQPVHAESLQQETAESCTYLANVAGKAVVINAEGLPLNELLTELKAVPNLSPQLVADITKAIRYGYSLPKGSDPYAAAQFYFEQCMLPKV